MPKLFLVPNSIAQTQEHLPAYIISEIRDVRVFFLEEPKSGRALLKKLDPQFPLGDCRFLDLNEHTTSKEVRGYWQVLKENDSAIISEAGCPCVADPGSDLVLLAHQHQIEVCPLVGPSSIILALMASGLSGQDFAFNGYLPKDKPQRLKKLKTLEERSHKEKQSQIFMETPYRNQALLEDVLTACQDRTLLCIAIDLAGSSQSVRTLSIQEWKRSAISLDKKPALFIIQRYI